MPARSSLRSIAAITALLLAALIIAGCDHDPAPDTPVGDYLPAISGAAVQAHVALLADDLYEGREAGKRGYDLAARYVATQFEVLDLKPGNAGSYYQPVPFRVARIVKGSRGLSVAAAGDQNDYATFGEFTSSPTLAGETVSITAPLVFVGYGVNAPSIERNDYEDVDLEGKIAVVVSGAPKALGSEVRAFYRSSRYHKFIELEERGAVGVIALQHRQISSDGAAVRGSKKDKYWQLDEHGEPKFAFGGLRAQAWLLEAGARRLFADAPISFEEMAASIEDETYASMDLGMTATLMHRITQRETTSDNVIAVLEGSDPVLKNEYLVMSAHLDGVGMGDETGDNIHNGYYDNASGIGTMLEVARAFADAPVRPKRSIMFLATTGEEKGLQCAEFFAANPPVPIDSIVANINMDMVMFLWQVQVVVGFGAEHSTLRDVLQDAATKAGVELSPDPFPERGYFTRSDQFPFVRQGIPAVFLATGFKTAEPDVDPEALYNHFMENHYHGPSDDAKLRFDTESAGTVALVNYLMASSIANAADRPTWQKDDFFGDRYGTDLTRAK